MRRKKAELRKAARETLSAISSPECAGFSSEIQARIRELPEWGAAGTVGLYAAQATEPDLSALLQVAGKTFCFPRVQGDALHFYRCDLQSAMVTSQRWGLLEPDPDHCEPVEPMEMDLLIVPGIAFDSAGGRLGRGGGFYDRCLALHRMAERAVGVCFHAQIVPEIPREPHDVHVRAVVTEQAVFRRA